MIPPNMTAIEIREPGPPQVLRPVERAVPQPRAGEVLIKVAAAGVNRPDVLQRKGAYAPPPGASDIPGLEVSGVVVAAAEGVREPAVGAAGVGHRARDAPLLDEGGIDSGGGHTDCDRHPVHRA